MKGHWPHSGQETRVEGKSKQASKIHHHFKKMKCFPHRPPPPGLAHSQFLQGMKKDVRHGGALLVIGQKNHKFKTILESDGQLRLHETVSQANNNFRSGFLELLTRKN